RAPQHFNPLARYLHWLMAIMILTMLFIGAAMMTSLHHRIWLVDVHRPLGIAILLPWFHDAHRLLAKLLFAVVLLHLSAALVHAWIFRDGVFASMAKSTSRPSKPPVER
ncbi:hypothetical protein CJ207_25755, partial [Klebsiella aerogenes]